MKEFRKRKRKRGCKKYRRRKSRLAKNRKICLKKALVEGGLIIIIGVVVVIAAEIFGSCENKKTKKNEIFLRQSTEETKSRQSMVGNNRVEVNKEYGNESVNENMFINSNSESYIIHMDGYNQDTIPAGCESVSVVMVLNYFNVKISPHEFIDKYLQKKDFYYMEGVLYGPSPEERFVGSPYDLGGLGCFPPVMVDAVNRLRNSGYPQSENLTVWELEDMSLEEICQEYVAGGIPVSVWTTMNMSEPKQGKTFYLEDGTKYTWKSGEHCMVLCGFDEKYYYFKDSLKNGETVSYEKQLAEKRYTQMGKRAMLITENEIKK